MIDNNTMIKDGFSSYSIYFGAYQRTIQRLADDWKSERLDMAFDKKGDFDKDIFDELERKRSDDAWKWAHSMRDKYTDEVVIQCHKEAEPALVAREPKIRKAILPYIDKAISMAMGKGLIPHIWAMASDNGLTDGVYLSDGKWRQEELQGLTDGDKEAIRKTSEDIYALALYLLEVRNLFRLPEALIGTIPFESFPLGGGPEAIDSMVTEENYEDFPSREEADLLLFIPFVVSRIDEAVYYSLAYSGEEYLEYLSSLSVEVDWDQVNGEKYGLYKNIKERS